MRNLLLFVTLATIAACRTPAPGNAGSEIKDTPPAADVMKAFETSCGGCHFQYLDDVTEEISWEKLKANATLITARLSPTVSNAQKMPPINADAEYQVTPAMRVRMYDAIKPYAQAGGPPADQNPTNLPIDKIKLPAGFKISVYAVAKGARSLTHGPDGTVFISTGGFSNPETKVYAARDLDGDKYAEKVVTLLDGQDNPNGIAFKDGALYVAERFKVSKYSNVMNWVNNGGTPLPQLVFNNLPTNGAHSWKYLAFGPDGKLYIPVGAPCNICNPDGDPATAGKFIRIFRMNPNGTQFEEVAKGVRNTVGFDWHPVTKELWFTDNGRDNMGDGLPPDELNRAATTGLNFGYPRCHGTNIPDPQFAAGANCAAATFTKPVRELGAHVAALGMRFYTGAMFPAAYKHGIFIAEHGSWNSSVPVGYRVQLVREQANGTYSYENFATGWSQPTGVWGRPVDVLVMADGALLVSDDKAGVVYRIWYEG
jgi:glucose/arabinose dehydrogenase